MTLTRRGSSNKKYAARRAWVTAHPERLFGVPGLHEDVTDSGRLALELLRAELLTLGLLGSSTEDTQRETIRRLVSELRGEHVGGEW